MKFIACLFNAVFLLLLPAILRADESRVQLSQKQGAAELLIEAPLGNVGQPLAPLSGHFVLTVQVEGGPDLEVRPPRSWTKSLDWKLLPRTPEPTRTVKEGRIHWIWSFELEPMRAGSLSLELASLRYRLDGGTAWSEAVWQPIALQVSTEIAQPDLQELRDITPPEALPGLPTHAFSWLPVMGGMILLTLVVGAWRWRRSQKRTAADPPPEAWARVELDRLEALVQAGLATETLHTELSDIIRRYLELRFPMHPLQQTTAEFLASIQSASLLSDEVRSLLQQFLDRCDLAKFAGVLATTQECCETIAMARTIVTLTTPTTAKAS